MVAAEASSEPYGYQLLEHWQQQGKDWEAFGIGSQRMESLGFQCFTYAHNLTSIKPFYIYTQLKELVKECKKNPPFCALLMDYGGFNLMLAKRLHKMKISVLYYIPPKLWAWKPSRIHKIKKYFKKVFVIFPFEVDFFRQHKVPVEFVGHPLVKEVSQKLTRDQILQERSRWGIRKEQFVLGLMPGSRDAEVRQHLAVQLKVAKELCQRNSHLHLRVLLLLAPTQSRARIQEQIAQIGSLDHYQPKDQIKENFSYVILQDTPAKMISLADVLLVASGTATLLTGLLQKPMVVMYRLHPFLYRLVRLLVNKDVRYTSWVNLLFQKEVVPECIQEKATVSHITPLLEKYFTSSSYRKQVIETLGQLPNLLNPCSSSEKVVERVTRGIEQCEK